MSGKYALIIGNTEYSDPGLAQLTAPGKDAEDFARVLKDKDVCAFDDVNSLLNQPEAFVRGVIDEFFDGKKPDDLLLFYFSGHGVKDEFNSLYLAFKNTTRARLRSTAIKSDYIREAMDQSRSRRQVAILDCCNSGAFPQGVKADTGGVMGIISAFQGRGRFVLTASDSTQFAWEGDKVIGETQNSLFTHFLLKGLEGEADRDGDGLITVDELYDYAHDQISKLTPKQTPMKSVTVQEGEIILRQFTRMEDIKPVALPDQLTSEIENLYPEVRLRAIGQLNKLLKGKNLGLARAAKEALEKIEAEDDSKRVAQVATQALESIRQLEQKAEAERKAKEEAERLAILKVEEERLAVEKAKSEQKAKEEAQRLLAEQKAEEERIANAKIEAERVAEEKRRSDAKAEAERNAREEAERILAEKKADEERIAKAKLEAERIGKEKRIAEEKAEAERLAIQKADEERIVKAKLEAQQRAKQQRIAEEKGEAERKATEKTEQVAGRKIDKRGGELFGYQVWIKAITRPKQETFIEIATSPVASYAKVYLGVFTVATISFLTNVLTQFLQSITHYSGIDVGQNYSTYSTTSLIGAIILAPIAGILTTIVFVVTIAIIQWVAKLFGGVGTYSMLAYASAAIYVPVTLLIAFLSPFGAIPYVGIVILIIITGISLYSAILQIIAIKAVNQFSWGKAIGSMVIPILVVFTCCILGSLVFFYRYGDQILNSIG